MTDKFIASLNLADIDASCHPTERGVTRKNLTRGRADHIATVSSCVRELCRIILTLEQDLRNVKMNQHERYLDHLVQKLLLDRQTKVCTHAVPLLSISGRYGGTSYYTVTKSVTPLSC